MTSFALSVKGIFFEDFFCNVEGILHFICNDFFYTRKGIFDDIFTVKSGSSLMISFQCTVARNDPNL